MTKGTPAPILLPIDVYGVSPASLEVLIRIASQMGCSVQGLFVEDSRLERVAKLPFTTEIVLSSGGERALHSGGVRERFTRSSERARHQLDALAREARVAMTYDSTEGPWLVEALQRSAFMSVFLPRREVAHGRQDSRSVLNKARSRRLGLVPASPEETPALLEIARAMQASGLVESVALLSTRAPGAVLPGAGTEALPELLWYEEAGPEGVLKLIRQGYWDLLVVSRHCLSGVAPASLESVLNSSSTQLLLV